MIQHIYRRLRRRPAVALALLAVGALAFKPLKEANKYFEIAKNIEIFTNVYKEVNANYVDELNPSELMRTGMEAMLATLDPYTNYIGEAEIEDFTMTMKGRYSGIGANVRKTAYDDVPVIEELYEGFPAAEAGIEVGDEILAVDGISTAGKRAADVDKILKGTVNSSIQLKMRRPISGKTYEVAVQRAEVNIPNVPYYGMIDDEIGYITLTTFTQEAGANVGNALKALQKEHDLKGVILDLRDNGGGLLLEAVKVCNVFLPQGELVTAMRGKVKENDRPFSTELPAIAPELPLAVLINGRSASASEIVSGTLQDLDRGVLVGQQSFGKGLVQNTLDVGYKSRVKITTAKYYIPSGRCIQAVSYKDGEPVHIPDSLRAVFKTRNGRKVLDGGGIAPDLKVPARAEAPVIDALIEQHVLFDFATRYAQQHDSIGAMRAFALSEADYSDFVAYARSVGFTYQTESEKRLEALQSAAQEEGYSTQLSSDFAATLQKIKAAKADDLVKYKTTIKDLLEREIAKRYYYEEGKIQLGLKNDEEVKTAIAVLKDSDRYRRILSGK